MVSIDQLVIAEFVGHQRGADEAKRHLIIKDFAAIKCRDAAPLSGRANWISNRQVCIQRFVSIKKIQNILSGKPETNSSCPLHWWII